MRNDLTVIYYTSNRERPEFEEKIEEDLLNKIGDLPLISVSQKPIDFGKNICVGDVGVSQINCRRQLLIGAKEAKTKFICAAEADFLYPEEYFEFVPEKENVIRLAVRVWVLFAQRGKMCIYSPKPRGSEGAMVVGRDYIVNTLEAMLSGFETWQYKREQDRRIPQLLSFGKFYPFECENPIVTFKTDNQMHRRTPHNLKKKTRDIPYWGNSNELLRRFSCVR